MEIINLIFDIFNSPVSWMAGILFFLGYGWVTKTSNDYVLAAHINDLQTYKTDKDGNEIITGAWTFRGAQPVTFLNPDGDCNVRTRSYSNAAQDNPTIKHYRGRGTEASPVIVQANDPAGEWTSYAWDGVGFIRVARIYMDVDGTPGVNDMPGRIDFEVTPDGSFTPEVRMSLGNSGLLTLNCQGAGGSIQRLDGKGGENRDFIWTISGAGADYDTLILQCEQTSGGEDFADLFAFHYLGQFGVGTLALNTKMSVGITIHQAGYDNEALALKSSDVAHGCITEAETNTYMRIKKVGATDGGARVGSYTDAASSVYWEAVYAVDDTTKNTGAYAPFNIYVAKISGTGLTSVGADANLFCIRVHTDGAKFIVDEDGDILYDGTAGPYQDHDDIELLAELEVNLDRSKKLKSKDKYKKKDLEDAKILRPFLSTKRLNMLLMGAVRQLNEKVEVLEAQLNN